MKGLQKSLTLAIGAMFLPVAAQAAPITTDVIAIVDESGSMAGEHAWLSSMINSLDSSLLSAAGSDPLSARYGLVGFGANPSHGVSGHQHNVGGGEFGTAAEFSTATGTLVLSGGFEDGYSGIDTALNYSLRPDAVANMILVTDEDRDVLDASLDFSTISDRLASIDGLLNAVLNVNLRCGDGSSALGIDADGNGFTANGVGGFNSCSGGVAVSGFGSTIVDYVNLALASGGGAWDLNQLRAGGLVAQSFTSAFVNIKVQEIVDGGDPSPVPEPGPLSLLGLGLVALGLSRRKQRS